LRNDPPAERYRNFLVDMDGVLYINEQPIASAIEFINRIKDERQVLLLTNNSKYTRAQYRDKLLTMGLQMPEERIMTSSVATACYLEENFEIRDATVFMLGGAGLKEELERIGMCILEGDDARHAQFVVVGWDTELSYVKVKIACLALRDGAVFIGTNSDATFPATDGLWPGAGAILASVETCAGRNAVVIGKPNVFMMDAALSTLGGTAEATLTVGDRLETDVLGGYRAGTDTCLVLTGVSKREDAEGFHPQPDFIVDSLLELL
jgi:4-nitrophenyl phosphatase